MSKNVLLISVQAIKDRTGVHKNLDESLIAPEIKTAQDTRIEPALGSSLFRALQQGVEANNLSAAMQTLLNDYVTDALVWFTVAALPLTSSYQFFTQGVTRGRSDDSELPSMSDMVRLVEKYENRGEFYRERLIRYLLTNRADFPDYDADGCGETAPAKRGYSVPIWLGDD